MSVRSQDDEELRWHYEIWRKLRADLYEDPMDSQAFHRYLITRGLDDPGEAAVAQFVGRAFDAKHSDAEAVSEGPSPKLGVPVPLKERAALIAQHYEKTIELTTRRWDQRNRTFIYLAIIISVSIAFTFDIGNSRALLVVWLAGYLEIDRSMLQESFPYRSIETSILVLVFYFTAVLFQSSGAVLWYYDYLKGLEVQIRSDLGIPEESPIYTREGSFYENRMGRFNKNIGYLYITMVGTLLGVFLAGRFFARGDFLTDLRQFPILSTLDIIIALMTLVYFYKYAEPTLAKVVTRGKKDGSAR